MFPIVLLPFSSLLLHGVLTMNDKGYAVPLSISLPVCAVFLVLLGWSLWNVSRFIERL